jgi:hypothetical protein
MPQPTAPVRRRPRRSPGAGVALCLALLVTACGSSQELDAAEAEEHYEAAVADVQAALGPLGYELVHAPATRSFAPDDGTCLYTPGNYEAEGLGADLGDEENWDEVLEVLNPVLEEHGFGTVDEPRREGAVLMAVVEDGHGAELSLGETGIVRIQGARVSPEGCEGS